MAEEKEIEDKVAAEQQATPEKTASQQPIKPATTLRPSRTGPVSQEQFSKEVKQDRLREFQLALYQITIALVLVLLGVLYLHYT